MAFSDKIITSIFGRRLGLQLMSSAQTGTAVAGRKSEFLVGPDDLRYEVTTGETTATNLKPYGVSFLTGTSAASSSVFVIDPPIPGVMKTVVFTSGSQPVYLRTNGGETFRTSADTTVATVISSTLTGCTVQLIGLTTSIYGLLTNGTSTISRAATT
jgi:hypothetical protein